MIENTVNHLVQYIHKYYSAHNYNVSRIPVTPSEREELKKIFPPMSLRFASTKEETFLGVELKIDINAKWTRERRLKIYGKP